jgi:hypothetical protein
MRPMVCPETLVRNYHYTLRSDPEESRCQADISFYNQEILWFLWNLKFVCHIKFSKRPTNKPHCNCNCNCPNYRIKILNPGAHIFSKNLPSNSRRHIASSDCLWPMHVNRYTLYMQGELPPIIMVKESGAIVRNYLLGSTRRPDIVHPLLCWVYSTWT